MGIDVYLEWDGKPEYEHDDPFDHFGDGIYLRESYFSKAYAMHDFVPETFATYPFTDSPMTTGPDGWPDGVFPFKNGVHYPWTILAGRIEAVAKKAQERYPEDADLQKQHIDRFMAFVNKSRELEEAGVQTWVENSY